MRLRHKTSACTDARSALAGSRTPLGGEELASRRWSAGDTGVYLMRKVLSRRVSNVFLCGKCYANRTELKKSLHLTDEQRQVIDIGSAICEPHQETFTAGTTGKMRFGLVAAAQARSRRAGILVAGTIEIALTAQISNVFSLGSAMKLRLPAQPSQK